LALALLVGFVAAVPAEAQSSGNACITEKIGGNPPCTANDVRIGRIEVVGGPTSCTEGETLTRPCWPRSSRGRQVDIGLC
jgi:hypothetical protein